MKLGFHGAATHSGDLATNGNRRVRAGFKGLEG